MTELPFDNESDTSGGGAPMAEATGLPELASPRQVRLLSDKFGYKREKVRLWSVEKAETVLRRCQGEEAYALNLAKIRAKEQDETTARGQASDVERHMAATYLEQHEGSEHEAVILAISAAVFLLRDNEVFDFAAYLVRQFRQTGVVQAPDLPQGEARE